MDAHFISEICEGYLVTEGYFTKYKSHEVKKIHETIVKDILENLVILRNNDIELYDKIYDRTRIEQYNIIKEYLDMDYKLQDEKILNEGIFSTSIMSAGALLTLMTLGTFPGIGPSIAKFHHAVLEKLGEFIAPIGEAIKNKGNQWRFRYAVIQRNLIECYKRSGVDPNKLRTGAYLSVSDIENYKLRQLSTPKTKEKIHELSICYLEFMIKSVGLLVKSYFTCLKNTGQLHSIKKITDQDIISMIAGLKLSSSCEEYFIELEKNINKFKNVVQTLFPNKREQMDLHQYAYNNLRKEINKQRDEVLKGR